MKSLFRDQVMVQQASRIQGEVSLVQVPSFVWITSLIGFILICSLIFLFNASYSRKTVVFGVLQPDYGVIRVQASLPGTVKQVLVQEGELVSEGQPLLKLSMQHFSSDSSELNASLQQEVVSILENLQQQKEQEAEKYNIRQTEVTNRISNGQKQLDQVKQQQVILAQRLELNQHLVEQLSKLSGTGYISSLDLTRQRDSLLSLQQQAQILAGQQLALEEQLHQQKSLFQQLPLDQKAIQTQLDNQLSELRNQLTRLIHEQSSTLTAPRAGTISGILPKAGHFMSEGSTALSLIPTGAELEAVMYVPTRAIAFIEHGQKVHLRFHAFPYERYGVHQGYVQEVSNTVFLPEEVTDMTFQEPSYRIRIKLASQEIHAYNRKLPLKAGMKLDADIITEQRSLIKWLFDPVYSIKGQL